MNQNDQLTILRDVNAPGSIIYIAYISSESFCLPLHLGPFVT